jgi:hypothetical protein
MSAQKVTETIKPDFRRDYLENAANCKSSNTDDVARGAGFEPARPVRTTGLAGLGYMSAPLAGFNLLPD